MSKFKMNSPVRDFYGDKNYTIEEGLLSGKGVLQKEQNLYTNWKPEYGYREGLLVMKVNGNQAKSFAKKHNLNIYEG